jgi:Effector Associated Constant Component 1
VRAAIQIQQTDNAFAELESLHGWLSNRPELRGAVALGAPARDPEEMGWLSDVVTAAVGNGGAVAALAGSLATWLVSRRSHVRIKVTGPDGRSTEVDVKQAKGNQAGVEAMLRKVLEEHAGGAT